MNRAETLRLMLKVASPVWENCARGTLSQNMPIECKEGRSDRGLFRHLEAVGRSFAGISAWLECPLLSGEEATQRLEFRALVIQGLEKLSEPSSGAALNFKVGNQPVVDAAFLAQGFLRAPKIWSDLSDEARKYYIAGFKDSRGCTVGFSNWLLFSGIIESFLMSIDAGADAMRIDYALRQHEQWYLGCGMYGDGDHYAHDYYNSYVIHPMLVDIITTVSVVTPRWNFLKEPILQRARDYSAIQELAIHPDGSYPPNGRSITYRCGAFHLLAQAALREDCASQLKPAQVRRALGSVISKTLSHPHTFDAQGWLTIGLHGHQAQLGESYISTGSLYLALCAFLPLGLGPNAAFWTDEDVPTTQEQLWG
jgi:hypothetical protein